MRLTGASRILQLHPTRRCNLRCLHCYSDSSPNAHDELASDVAVAVVHDAAALGYDVLSVSGGEPMLYRPLAAVLLAARASGMRTQVVTNGLLLAADRLQSWIDLADLVVVSVDDAAADDDRMRCRPGCFDQLRAGLDVLRARGTRFGILFTLTMHNLHQLASIAELAVEAGAALLQVHPLSASGRAQDLQDCVPDEREAMWAIAEVLRLQRRYRSRLALHSDIIIGSEARHGSADHETLAATLSSTVSPLVIEPDGTCVPFEFGFPREYSLGNISRGRLRDFATTWWSDNAAMITRALERIRVEPGRVELDCYRLLREQLDGSISCAEHARP